MNFDQPELMRLISMMGRPRVEPLITIRCGRMSWDPETKKCVPDPRRGMLQLVKQSGSGALQMGWKTSALAPMEDDVLIVEDAYMAPIKGIKAAEEGRCFAIHFTSSKSKKFVYWMQDPDSTVDEENLKKFNDLIKCPVWVKKQEAADKEKDESTPAPCDDLKTPANGTQ